MLKIKDSVDLKELEKFGYKLGRDGLCMHIEFILTLGNDQEQLHSVYIDTTTKIIEVCNEEEGHDVLDGGIEDWLLEELWKAKLIEEVEV